MRKGPRYAIKVLRNRLIEFCKLCDIDHDCAIILVMQDVRIFHHIHWHSRQDGQRDEIYTKWHDL